MGNARYERQKQIKESRSRHNSIVDALTKQVVTEFEHALIEIVPKCRETPGNLYEERNPDPWTDWSSDPERREWYESEAPTAEQALKMCEGCPLREMRDNLCLRYAELTGQKHGVWGGTRFENGKKLKG